MSQLLSRSDLQAHAALPPTPGLTDEDLHVLTAALADIPGWSLQQHRDYATGCSLVLIPEGDDAVAPTLLVSREMDGLSLSACRFDVLREVASACSAEALLPTLRAFLRLG